MLRSITEEQKQELDKKIVENSRSFKEKTDDSQEQREKLKLYKQTRLSSDMSEVKTQAEIKEEEAKLTKIEEERDKAIGTDRLLTERLKGADSVLEKLSDQVIAIKTYGENAQKNDNNNDDEAEPKVWRFALIAENLSDLVGDKLERTVLHPLEIVLLKQVFQYFLTTLDEAPGGVIFDIFKRTDTQEIAKYEKITFPETHSVVLWKENGIIYLIDPSNDTFSNSLLGAIKEQQLFKDVQGGIKGVLYSNREKDGKKVGREDENTRDCIDIAVKIVLELRAQTESDKSKKSTKKFDDTFSQLPSENRFAKHLQTASNKGVKINRQLRELTATSTETRHNTLSVLQNLYK